MELRRFLKARRAEAVPQVAAVSERRRRRAGMRIEEVCAVADVSTSWYGALESGKPIGVAPRTLDRIAAALRLSDHDREHLFALALPPAPRSQPPPVSFPARAILDGFVAGPAMLLDQRLDVVAHNRLAERLYRFTHDPNDRINNIAWRVFTDPDRRRFFTNWSEHARRVAGILRGKYAQYAGDPRLDELVSALLEASADFRELWDAVVVRGTGPLRKEVFVEGIGAFALDIVLLPVPASPLTVILQTPAGDADAACLARLEAVPD